MPNPDEAALKEALLASAGLFVGESTLRAAGESGRLFLQVEVHLERGRVQWTKGRCFFERRIDMGRS